MEKATVEESSKPETIGGRLKVAMERAKIKSEGELSRRSDVHQPTIHRILTNQSQSPRRDNLEKLAASLNVSLSWLAYGIGGQNVQGEKNYPAGDETIRDKALKALVRERFNDDEAEFAKAINRSDNLVSQYLNGHRSVSEKFARHVESSLDLPDRYLDSDNDIVAESSPAYRSEIVFTGGFEAWDENTPPDPNEVDVPLYREVELAAGSGRTEVIENQGAKLKFAKSTLRRASVVPENAACAFVAGNSMEPMIPDGSTIGINKGDTYIRDGKVYAIDHDGMLRVKFLYRQPGGGVRLVSANTHEHPTEDYSPEDFAQQIRILGRVFWWSVLDI